MHKIEKLMVFVRMTPILQLMPRKLKPVPREPELHLIPAQNKKLLKNNPRRTRNKKQLLIKRRLSPVTTPAIAAKKK